MTFDGSDRKQVREREKESARADRERIDYVRRIMSDGPGRAWMHGLLIRCHIFHTPFVRGSADQTAFNLGEQNIGLQVFADVAAHCPREYILMSQEAQAKEIVDDRRNSDDRTASGEQPGGQDPDRGAAGSVATEYDPYRVED